MQYTIFELERIEKVLTAKLEEARDALELGREKFLDDHPNMLVEDFDPLEAADMKITFLRGEVDLFERGINALYSYWNSTVEIFIDKMRTRTEKEFPEAGRKPVIDPNGEGEHEAQ